MGLASCDSMGSLLCNSLWLIAVDPHRGGSISLRPTTGGSCQACHQYDYRYIKKSPSPRMRALILLSHCNLKKLIDTGLQLDYPMVHVACSHKSGEAGRVPESTMKAQAPRATCRTSAQLSH